MIALLTNGVVLPPEITNGLIAFSVITLTVLGGIVVAFGAYLKARFDTAIDNLKQDAKSDKERQAAENEKLKLESSNNAEAVKLAIEIARTTTSRLDKAEATIDSQDKQLLEARTNSIERDRKIGELQALLSKTASERDQEVQQRKEVEKQRDNAIAEREVMKQQIADLKVKAAEFDKLSARVEELERRQQERHDAINKLQEQIADIELARMSAVQERDALKAELEVERRKSQSFPTPEPAAGGAQ